MPTTEPLDDDENGDFDTQLTGDIAGGPLKTIAQFAQPSATPQGSQPRAAVPKAAATATAPLTAAAATPGARRNITLRTPSVGLHGSPRTPRQENAQQTTVETATHAAATRNAPYTPVQITEAWKQYAESHGAERLLVSAMRASRLTPGDKPSRFNVAQSELHLNIIREHLADIRRYVCNVVNNDNVDFDFQVVSEDSPLAWNDREFVARIVKETPAAGEFIERLKLSLL